MKCKRGAAVLLALTLVAGCFSGCDSRGKPEEPTTAAPTGPGSQKWNGGQIEENLTDYSHCGLHIQLDSSYTVTAGSRGDPFTFRNGQICGGIEYGALPTKADGTPLDNGEAVATFLKEELGGVYAVENGRTGNGIPYTEIRGAYFCVVRATFVYAGKGWNLWLRCNAGENLREQMVKIIENATFVTAEAPLGRHDLILTMNPAVECAGLVLTWRHIIHEEAKGRRTTFSSGNITGEIYSSTTYSFLTSIHTIEELADNWLEIPLANWDHVEHSTDGELEKLVVYNDNFTDNGFEGTVYAFYKKGSVCWKVEARGGSSKDLVKFVSSGRVDPFGYNRSKIYDIKEFATFEAIVQDLKASGFEDWGRYKLIINGLDTQVMFEMYGAKVETVSAYGRTDAVSGVYLTGDDGTYYGVLGEETGSVWLNLVCGSMENSHIWVFSKKMNKHYLPEENIGVVLYPIANGGAGFRKYDLRYLARVGEADFDPLNWTVSREQKCYDEGRGDIRFGEMTLHTDAEVTVAQGYDLDGLFAAAKAAGRYEEFRNVDMLLESNLVRYPC